MQKTHIFIKKMRLLSSVEAKNQKNFTTTLYVVAAFYNPFSDRAVVPVGEEKRLENGGNHDDEFDQ